MCRQVDVGKFSARCLRKSPMSTPASLQCQHKLLCKTSVRKKFQSTFVCVLVWEKNIDIGEFLDVFDWTLFVVVMSWEGSCAWTTHQDPSIVWKRARLELLTLLCDIFRGIAAGFTALTYRRPTARPWRRPTIGCRGSCRINSGKSCLLDESWRIESSKSAGWRKPRSNGTQDLILLTALF